MKHILNILFLFISTTSYTQKVYEVSSFYFSEPQPSSLPEVKEFDESVRGVYELSEQKHTKLEIRKDSILAKFFIVFPVTEKEIAANEKLYVENEMLYGVAPKGLPFIRSNDTLIVAMNQIEVFCETNNYVVKHNKNVYYINEKVANGRWRTIVLDVSGKELFMQEFNHDLAEKELSKIPKDVQYDNEMRVYITTPSDKEFYSLVKSKGYSSDKIIYRKK